MCYLVSDVYTPTREFGIHPLDPELGIDYQLPVDQLLLSPKDQVAPSLQEALEQGLLPHIEQREPVK